MKRIQKKASLLMTLLAVLFISFPFATNTHAMQPQYPILQLGNCRDAQECYYYCEIPQHTPACWSYGKYVIEKNVLGTITKSPDEIAKEHGITFPVAELGNCTSAQACMQYCSKPENQQACTDFGKKKGLIQDNNNQHYVNEEKILSDAKTQLGCDSKDSCQAFCSDQAHQQRCEQFAQNEGLNHTQNPSQPTTPSSAILQAAKQELGCDSQDSCMNFCSNPDNKQKCQSFAQAHNFTPPQSQQTQQLQQSYPSGMDRTPPCNSQESCLKWCKDNPEKCKALQQQYNQSQQSVSPYPSYQQPHGNYQQMPCSTDQECFQYCQGHPNQCPGFQQNNSGYQNNGYNSQNQQSGATQQNYNSAPSTNGQPTIQQQSQSPQNTPNSSADQQKMCSQTIGCSWTGSTCNCSSGH